MYGSARASYLKMLNTIHHQGLRLALGAFTTSPVESLYVEAGELPLEQRRIKLSLQYITKLRSTPSNPAYDCIFRPNYEHKYIKNTKVTAPLGIRMKEHIEGCDIQLHQIMTTTYMTFLHGNYLHRLLIWRYILPKRTKHVTSTLNSAS